MPLSAIHFLLSTSCHPLPAVHFLPSTMSEGSLRAMQQTGPSQELLLSQARGCSGQGHGVHQVPRGQRSHLSHHRSCWGGCRIAGWIRPHRRQGKGEKPKDTASSASSARHTRCRHCHSCWRKPSVVAVKQEALTDRFQAGGGCSLSWASAGGAGGEKRAERYF